MSEPRKKRFTPRPLLVAGAGLALVSIGPACSAPVGNLMIATCEQLGTCDAGASADAGSPDAGAADAGATDAGTDGGQGGDR